MRDMGCTQQQSAKEGMCCAARSAAPVSAQEKDISIYIIYNNTPLVSGVMIRFALTRV